MFGVWSLSARHTIRATWRCWRYRLCGYHTVIGYFVIYATLGRDATTRVASRDNNAIGYYRAPALINGCALRSWRYWLRDSRYTTDEMVWLLVVIIDDSRIRPYGWSVMATRDKVDATEFNGVYAIRFDGAIAICPSPTRAHRLRRWRHTRVNMAEDGAHQLRQLLPLLVLSKKYANGATYRLRDEYAK